MVIYLRSFFRNNIPYIQNIIHPTTPECFHESIKNCYDTAFYELLKNKLHNHLYATYIVIYSHLNYYLGRGIKKCL